MDGAIPTTVFTLLEEMKIGAGIATSASLDPVKNV